MYYSPYIPTIDPVILHIYGPIAVRWYSLAYIAGILVCWYQSKSLIKILKFKYNNEFSINNLTEKNFDDFIGWAVLAIIIGGRLGNVLIYDLAYYLSDPIEILKIYNGGMAFHGAIIALVVVTFTYWHKQKVSFFLISDIILSSASIGILFGRIANFVNGELYGKATNSIIGVVFYHANLADSLSLPQKNHPSQLYEAFSEGLLIYMITMYLAYKTPRLNDRGFITGTWLILYSLSRFICEFYRIPDDEISLYFITISTGQALSIITLWFGIIILSIRHRFSAHTI